MESSGFGRLITVLTSPGKTFRSIAERPTWAAPLVLFVALTMVLGFVIHQRTDYADLMEWTAKSRDLALSQEDMDRAVDIQERFGGVGAVAGGVIVALVSLFFALLYWLGLKLVGGELGYKEALSVSLYAGVPVLVQFLLTIVLVLPQQSIDPQRLASRNFLASNLAFLAPEDAGPVLTNLLASLDFFALWAVVLAVIGYRIVARVSTASAAAVVIVIWLLGVGIRLGFAALGGGLG